MMQRTSEEAATAFSATMAIVYRGTTLGSFDEI